MPEPIDLPDAELAELLEAVANRDLTDAQRARLAERLRAAPAARRAFIQATAFDAMLAHEFPPTVSRIASGALELPELATLPTRRWWLAAAALIMGALLLGYLLPREPAARPRQFSDTAADTPLIRQVATISNVATALGFEAGQRLSPGPLELPAGRVEVTFDCGAVVTITGPARLDIESEFRGFLQRGQLTARVPHEADGFVIQTPSSHIRDLGTAFAVEVAQSGASELHVIEGEVEASPSQLRQGLPTVLREKHALRFTNDTVVPVAFDGARFLPPLPAPDREVVKSVHWSFDQLSGNETADDSGLYPMRLLQEGSVPETSNRTASGVFGTALNFDGKGDYAESEHPGIGGSGPRTVAFWVRLPVGHRPGHPNGIVTWGVPRESRKWQVAWNEGLPAGEPGALRQEFGEGFVIGSTDLRDGQWHHVAVVFHGGVGADVTTHFKLYVDGRLETLTGRKQQVIKTDTTSPIAEPVVLGRYIGQWANREKFYFEGQLDEVFIFEAALSPSQIVRLKEKNAL